MKLLRDLEVVGAKRLLKTRKRLIVVKRSININIINKEINMISMNNKYEKFKNFELI